MKEFLTNKTIWLFGFLGAFLAPVMDALIATGILIMIDFVFGLAAAKKRGDDINSKRMSQTIIKMLAYQLLLVTSFISEKYLISKMPIVEITTGFIAVVELLSIAENFTVITGHDFLSYLKKMVFDKMKNGRDLVEDKKPKIGSEGDTD